MSKYLVDTIKQKFELRSYRVLFDIKDSVHAETILNSLDRSSPHLTQIYGLTKEPAVEVFLYPDPGSFEKATQKAMAMGETVRVVGEDNVILLIADRIPQPLDEEVSRALSTLVFNNEVKEREIGMRQFRTPAWLREGHISQVSYMVRSDSKAFLLNGFTQLQEAEKKDQMIKPGILSKPLVLIPDPVRRTLAFHQAFYMVKFLQTVYPEKFFKRYATLMAALEDMEGEVAFGQITGYDFDRFFTLFREWVRSTNIWVAVSD